MKINFAQMDKIEIIILIIICNFIISFIYFIIKCIKRDAFRGLIMGIFMIVCPVIGPFYLFFSWLIYAIYFKRNNSKVSIEELSLNKEKINVILKPDINSALNKVPIEEALIISDNKSVRKLLLDVLREDSKSSAKSILKAVEHKDSEVSHYAASAISDIINEFKIKEKQFREDYYIDKENVELSRRYVDYLYDFLEQNILSTAEQKLYCGMFEQLIITMKSCLPEEITGELYNKLICVLLSLEENDRAGFWVYHALNNNGNELGSYKAGLRYYYINENRREFLLLIDNLKKSDIVLDHEMLEMVRFYS
jgi:hypothetical protein